MGPFFVITLHYEDAVGKFFSRLLTKCGLTDPVPVLNSLRHGGITKLHAAGCPHNIVQMLAGHAAQGVHDQVYVHREALPLKLLKDGLEKLRYDDVVKALGFKEFFSQKVRSEVTRNS